MALLTTRVLYHIRSISRRFHFESIAGGRGLYIAALCGYARALYVVGLSVVGRSGVDPMGGVSGTPGSVPRAQTAGHAHRQAIRKIGVFSSVGVARCQTYAPATAKSDAQRFRAARYEAYVSDDPSPLHGDCQRPSSVLPKCPSSRTWIPLTKCSRSRMRTPVNNHAQVRMSRVVEPLS